MLNGSPLQDNTELAPDILTVLRYRTSSSCGSNIRDAKPGDEQGLPRQFPDDRSRPYYFSSVCPPVPMVSNEPCQRLFVKAIAESALRPLVRRTGGVSSGCGE